MKTNTRYQIVVWHSKPVFIPYLSVEDTKGELGFQIYSAAWLNTELKAHPAPLPNNFSHWHHSAGENRGSGIYGLRAGLNAKRSGQQRGWPDWVNCHRKIALELKLAKGQVRPEQKEWLAYFAKIGWHSEVVRSFPRFKELVSSEAK